ncbi:MAG TPA: hypothetical protein VL201_01530 [Patescibacteria group bacterium]|jgi:hypothetical protein|nr:hypothetical protein [Patescibacteria group bacterium]
MLFKKEEEIIEYYNALEEDIETSDRKDEILRKYEANMRLAKEASELIDIMLNEHKKSENPASRVVSNTALKIIGSK